MEIFCLLVSYKYFSQVLTDMTDMSANFLLFRSEETLVDILEVVNTNSCVIGVYGNKNHEFSIFWLSVQVLQHICIGLPQAYFSHCV